MNSEEDEDTGPSVDSNNAEERIAARRLRIQKRIEAQRRSALGNEAGAKEEENEEPTKSRKQIEDSRIRLVKLIEDGKVLVSNIRVAGDAREQARRNEEDDVLRQRKERLEQESKAGGERFDEITKRWATALEKEIPQHLQEALMEQRGCCDAMVDEKNKLINDFQTDSKSKDDLYVKDLKKQAEDIDLIAERMQEQISNLTKAKRQELNEIEKSFVTERNELLEQNRKKWLERMEYRREKEEEFMKTREKHVDEQEVALEQLRTQDWEEYNQVKIHLENDVQILEQQLQQMRATYQLNQEKLEYNFQVLKKRDEENTITKSQQKRKITRLQDVLNALRSKFVKQEKQYADENHQLTDDYKRITEHFHELQTKSKHFIAADAKKFHDIWCMNEEECKDLVKGIVDADKLVSEQQFGTLYTMPDLHFMDNVGPLNAAETRGKPVSASDVVKQILNPSILGETLCEGNQDTSRSHCTILGKISAVTIKRIFELLCDESGFLVEQKLKTLLAPLENEERSLIKLDSIFSALGVETEDDVHNLSRFFIKVKAEYDEPFYYEEKKKEEEEMKVITSSDSVELIDRNLMFKVIRDFIENAKKTATVKDKRSQFHLDVLEERDNTCDAEYWGTYVGVISDRKEQLMDAFLQALSKYSEVLSSRAKLLTDTDVLRHQNIELRMLLHQYVNSKVNRELEIPPTRVLQLELNTPNNSNNQQ